MFMCFQTSPKNEMQLSYLTFEQFIAKKQQFNNLSNI